MYARIRFASLMFGVSVAACSPLLAADLPAPAPFAPAAPTVPSEWSFRFTPYGWLPSMNGTQTIRGRTAKVDALPFAADVSAGLFRPVSPVHIRPECATPDIP